MPLSSEEAFPTEWTFADSDKTASTSVDEDGCGLLFHSNFSYGTAVIRGRQPLVSGFHHYWEVQMQSPIYGSAVMVGVGTDKAPYNAFTTQFTSVLGLDDQSWGYSHLGQLHHDCGGGGGRPSKNLPRRYAPDRAWRKGTVIGIYYNGWTRTLEFYLDRVPLGVAFQNLPAGATANGVNIYPMISATSAKTQMRLICAQKSAHNLAFEAAKALCKATDAAHHPPRSRHLSAFFQAGSKYSPIPHPLYSHNNIYQDSFIVKTREKASWTLSLAPGIRRFLSHNCWYLIGARLEDLYDNDVIGKGTQPQKPFSSAADTSCTDGLIRVVSSSDEQAPKDATNAGGRSPLKKRPRRQLRQRPQRLQQRPYQEPSSSSEESSSDFERPLNFDIGSRLVGPGPSSVWSSVAQAMVAHATTTRSADSSSSDNDDEMFSAAVAATFSARLHGNPAAVVVSSSANLLDNKPSSSSGGNAAALTRNTTNAPAETVASSANQRSAHGTNQPSGKLSAATSSGNSQSSASVSKKSEGGGGIIGKGRRLRLRRTKSSKVAAKTNPQVLERAGEGTAAAADGSTSAASLQKSEVTEAAAAPPKSEECAGGARKNPKASCTGKIQMNPTVLAKRSAKQPVAKKAAAAAATQLSESPSASFQPSGSLKLSQSKPSVTRSGQRLAALSVASTSSTQQPSGGKSAAPDMPAASAKSPSAGPTEEACRGSKEKEDDGGGVKRKRGRPPKKPKVTANTLKAAPSKGRSVTTKAAAAASSLSRRPKAAAAVEAASSNIGVATEENDGDKKYNLRSSKKK